MTGKLCRLGPVAATAELSDELGTGAGARTQVGQEEAWGQVFRVFRKVHQETNSLVGGSLIALGAREAWKTSCRRSHEVRIGTFRKMDLFLGRQNGFF